jgi:TetR/AcrR family transcriptional repressor of lmrAB and yxaGH operons
MPRTTDSRDKALDTAELLFRTQGYAATGLQQIIAESGSPKGSFYFHFPGGKEHLAREVVNRYGKRSLAAIKHFSQAHAGHAEDFVRGVCSALAAEMRQSNYELGCAVQNLANEFADPDTPLVRGLRAALDSWITAAEEHFIRCGLSPSRSREAAHALVAGLEGARTLARLQRTGDAFTSFANTMCRALAD